MPRLFSVFLAFALLLLALPGARAQESTPAATAAAPGTTVTLNGADIYYEVVGTGEPVILVHGGLGSGRVFAKQIPALVNAGYQLIVIDSRGHGHSSHGPDPLSYELMASDVLGVMDHLGIAKADLVGWSDGAIIGLELAINHPERLHKVVAYGANFTPEGVIDATPVPAVEAALAPFFAATFADYQQTAPNPEGFDALAEELFALYKVAPNFTDEQLQSITTPILILDGAEEEFVKPEHTLQLAELIPSADLIIMPGVGHFAPIQQPEEFNRIVLEYLAASAGDATPAP
jgi:pimeloyl-ACP methyl ester carboxylesterase